MWVESYWHVLREVNYLPDLRDMLTLYGDCKRIGTRPGENDDDFGRRTKLMVFGRKLRYCH